MNQKKHLLEVATLLGDSASEDGTWRVRLISEGRGSSGVYTASLLENHHHAFDNVLSFRNHPQWFEGPEARDFTMIAGQILGETWTERDERGLVAIYGNYLPDEEYRTKLEQYKNKLGLSIYIEGSGYEDENGDYIVDWFNPEDPYASVDVVIAPGARGKFLESARKMYAEREDALAGKRPGTRQAEQKKEIAMDEELKETLKGISDALAILVANEKAKVAAEAQVEADKAAVTSAVEAYANAVHAIEQADLLEPQRLELLEAAKSGEDISQRIEVAKKVKEAAVEAASRISESAGYRDFGKSETKYGAYN